MRLWSPQPVLGDLLFVSKTVIFETMGSITKNFLQQGYGTISKLHLKIYVAILDK
jgi:hypothetical protein